MAWQTPKTNWQAADVVSKDDFNRIEGNVQELQNTKETPAGAQAKADAAETNAKSHANGLVGILSSLATTAKNNIVAAINEIHSWLGQLDNDFNTHKAEDASTTAKGHVQLNNTVTSTSTTQAATANAVKTVNDGAKAYTDAHEQKAAPHSGHATTVLYTATLNTTWSGSSAPYSKVQTVAGILATDTPIIDIVLSGAYATDIARLNAWKHVYRAVTSANIVTFYADVKPTVELPVQIKVVR